MIVGSPSGRRVTATSQMPARRISKSRATSCMQRIWHRALTVYWRIFGRYPYEDPETLKRARDYSEEVKSHQHPADDHPA